MPVLSDKKENGRIPNGKTAYTNDFSTVYSSCYSNGVNNGYMSSCNGALSPDEESRKIK